MPIDAQVIFVLGLSPRQNRSAFIRLTALQDTAISTEFSSFVVVRRTMIYSCVSVRRAEISSLLSVAFVSGNFNSVKSLRREPHSPESSCWLHAPTFCLSTLPSN